MEDNKILTELDHLFQVSRKYNAMIDVTDVSFQSNLKRITNELVKENVPRIIFEMYNVKRRIFIKQIYFKVDYKDLSLQLVIDNNSFNQNTDKASTIVRLLMKQLDVSRKIPFFLETAEGNRKYIVGLICKHDKKILFYLNSQNLNSIFYGMLQKFINILNNNTDLSKVALEQTDSKNSISSQIPQNVSLLWLYLINIYSQTDIYNRIKSIETNLRLFLNSQGNEYYFFQYFSYRFSKDYLTTEFEKQQNLVLLRYNLFTWRQIIDNKIEKYTKLSNQLPKNIKVGVPYSRMRDLDTNVLIDSIEIPYDSYLRTISSTIFGKEFFSNDFVNYFYRRKISKIENSGKLLLNRYTKNVTFFEGKTEKTYLYNSEVPKIVYNFIKTNLMFNKFLILEIINTELKNETHYNVALLEKLENKDTIIMNYYEPHGSQKIDNDDFLVTFFRDLMAISDKKLIILYNREEKSSQALSNETVGYCVLFGFFWIDMILSIIKYNLENDSYINSSEWVNEVETYYIHKITPENLYKIIIAFTSNLVSNFLASKDKKYNDSFQEALNNSITTKNLGTLVKSQVIDKKEFQTDNYQEIKRESYTKEEFEKQRESSPEIAFEDWEKLRIAELKEYKEAKQYLSQKDFFEHWRKYITQKGYTIKPDGTMVLGKLIGSQCNSAKECFSRRCKFDKDGNYCYP